MKFDETKLCHGARDLPSRYGAQNAPQHAEIAGAMIPAIWVEKNPITGFQTYPKRNQAASDDCVEYSIAKALGVDFLNLNGYYRELSPRSVYAFTFQAGGGSDSIQSIEYSEQQGMSLEDLFVSDNLTEALSESSAGYGPDAKQIAMLYRPPGHVECATDFETIASILQSYQQQGKKKVVMVTVMGENNGTWLSMNPQPPAGAPNPDGPGIWLHKVPVCDFGTINGQKMLAIDQSWGISIIENGVTYPVGNEGQQFLGENYAPYIYGGLYTADPIDPTMPAAQVPKPPKYTWTQQLQAGSTGPDVLALQQALQSLGFFPVSSVVGPTGSYFGITKQAVETFQATFGIPVTGIVDGPTIAKLNSIFNA